jgi:hypothetical protein
MMCMKGANVKDVRSFQFSGRTGSTEKPLLMFTPGFFCKNNCLEVYC